MPNLGWSWSSGAWFGDVTAAGLPASIDPIRLLLGAHVGRRF